MKARQKWEKAAALILICSGVILILWPLGQSISAWQVQRALRAEFAAHANASTNPQDARKAPPLRKLSPHSSKKATGKARPISLAMRKWEPVQLSIKVIDLDAIVVRGVHASALRQGPGYDPASVLPGQDGNCVIAAHRNVYGWWFYRLHELRPGDLIELQSSRAVFTYMVASATQVDRHDTAVLQSWPGAQRLTLYTCTLPKSQDRVIVFADYIGARPISSS